MVRVPSLGECGEVVMVRRVVSVLGLGVCGEGVRRVVRVLGLGVCAEDVRVWRVW